jgi:hypothetical protein
MARSVACTSFVSAYRSGVRGLKADVRGLVLRRLGAFDFSIYAAPTPWAKMRARMEPLLRDRILLLQFLCTTGAVGPMIGSVQRGANDKDIEMPLDRTDAGTHIG